jgi:hypothetical protein
MRKGKRKETNKKTQTSDRKPNKGKQQDHLKEESLGTLRQGQRLDTTETKASSSKEYKPPKQSSKTHKSSLAHMHAPPEPMQLPLKMRASHFMKQSCCTNSSLTGQTTTPARPVPNI